MPYDKLYLDTILSVPGLLSSHQDWHQAQDTVLPALLGQDRCLLRASHPAQKHHQPVPAPGQLYSTRGAAFQQGAKHRLLP